MTQAFTETAMAAAALILGINAWLNALVWGPPFMILLAGTGIYLTIRLRGLQFTHIRSSFRDTFGRLFKRKAGEGEGAISSFQAVAVAMAATIGVGNIAGVATALSLGGPGAIFWMWMVGLVGMATKFGEASLAVQFRKIAPDGRINGGAFHTIERGLGWRWLALIYAGLAGLAAFGIGNMVQANTFAHALESGFDISPVLSGLVAMILVGVVTLGGIRRIAETAEKVVPLMGLIYIGAALVILALNHAAIPSVVLAILRHAFEPHAAMGGFAGASVWAAMRYGVARGIFSNEAGLGSASIVHAQARNTPERQGLWGMWEVAIDTLVLCTLTALVILITGVLPGGHTGAALATDAFDAGLPSLGGWLVPVALVLFSYTTMISWGFYGEKSFEYLAGSRAVMPYRIAFLILIPVGATGGLQDIWDIADTLNGLMAIPNLIALIALGGMIARHRKTLIEGWSR